MAEKIDETNDAETIYDTNTNGTVPLDELTETQISELYYLLTGLESSESKAKKITRIMLLKRTTLPETKFINVSSTDKETSLFTYDGNRNLSEYVLKLLAALLVFSGDKSKVKLAKKNELRDLLIEYNQAKGTEEQQNLTTVGYGDVDIDYIISHVAALDSPRKKTASDKNTLGLREILRDSGFWAAETHLRGPFMRATDILKQVKEYVSKRVLGTDGVHINRSLTGLRSMGITGITELFKDDYDAGKGVQTFEQKSWANSTLLSTSSINLSKNHNNGMGLLGAIMRQKLFLLEEEFRLGTEAITMSLDGQKFHPVGKTDFICMNDLGQLVIIDLKTPINSPNYIQFVFTRHRAIQLEMYALMFDIICKILGIPAGIAYTGILYWNPENNNSFDSKGSETFCKIPRNPEIYLNVNTKMNSNLLKSINL